MLVRSLRTVERIVRILGNVIFLDRFESIGGRRRDERSIRASVHLGHCIHDGFHVQCPIVRFHARQSIGRYTEPVLSDGRLVLVVSRPENDGRVRLKAFHLIGHLVTNIPKEGLIDRISTNGMTWRKAPSNADDLQAAGEHEIVP